MHFEAFLNIESHGKSNKFAIRHYLIGSWAELNPNNFLITRLILIESQPKKVVLVLIVCVFVFVAAVLGHAVVVVNVGPRNLNLKSGQNRVSN